MGQFDVHPNPSRSTQADYPYIVDIQSPHLPELATRIVIPLARKAAFPSQAMKGLTPDVTFKGEDLLLVTPQIASLPVRVLPEPIGSLAHIRNQILSASDFAITGI